MKGLKEKSVDMVFADLPYGTTACKWDEVIPMEPLWEQYNRVTKDNAAIVLFASQPFAATLIVSNLEMFKYEWIWRKNTASGFAFAKYQPMRNHEEILVFAKGRTNYYPQKVKSLVKDRPFGRPNGRIQSTGTDHYPGMKPTPANVLQEFVNPKTVLEFGTVGNQNGNKVHPTQKPVALLEYLIKTYTNAGETVLDNTMGSGSTGVACVNTGRKFIGIEKEPKYFEIAKSRIREAQRGPVQPELSALK